MSTNSFSFTGDTVVPNTLVLTNPTPFTRDTVVQICMATFCSPTLCAFWYSFCDMFSYCNIFVSLPNWAGVFLVFHIDNNNNYYYY